jgi:hypothetical protein
MTAPVHYTSATAFRQAVEARLANLAQVEHTDIQRLRRQFAFDRLLGRLFREPAAPWALKGGYAMELRLAAARATRDIDLAFCRHLAGGGKSRNSRILELLQASASVDMDDYFSFLIGELIKGLDGAPYGGGRFPVEARMDGRPFARFHLDIGVGDAIMDPLEKVHGRDWLGFAGIPAAEFRAISREQQFAEKYHAYTMPRHDRENSRARDLVDMLLLIRRGRLHRVRTSGAIHLTFQHRHTHVLPVDVPPPPGNWEKPFAALCAECGLKVDFARAHTLLAKFISRLLRSDTP